MLLDDARPRPGALNMAIDEALLRSARSPLLRFYRWSEPSVSFGYFGRYDDALSFAAGRAIARRWTGGGIVPHGDDLTYSIIIPAQAATYHCGSRALYARVHGAIAAALRDLGMPAVLAERDAPTSTNACFASPVIADVMEGTRKIAGAAQRKTRAGLLHQGSIQRENLPAEFRRAFARRLSEQIDAEELSDSVLEQALQLAEKKYSTEAWLRRH